MDYRIFNVRTDVNACNCTWGCADTIREFELKVDSGRKIPCRTRESNLHQWHAGLMLYHLSYIPSPSWQTNVSPKDAIQPPNMSIINCLLSVPVLLEKKISWHINVSPEEATWHWHNGQLKLQGMAKVILLVIWISLGAYKRFSRVQSRDLQLLQA